MITPAGMIPIEPQAAIESRAQYGQRLVLHIMSSQETGGVSDSDLELALSQSAVFFTRGMDARVVDAVQHVRAHICVILAARKREMSTPVVSTVQVPAVEPSTPNEGPMAKLPVAPLVRPPSGSLATIEF